MQSIVQKVREYIVKNKLISPCDTVVCGFSGGADSMCMLELLWELSSDVGFKVVAAHLNHGLRGADADADENACMAFCNERSIEFFSVKKDIKKIAEELKCGEEETGRIERYSFFDEIASRYNNSVIATAHTKNDRAETVLHHVIRGTSIKGLVGIRPKRDNIIRPILCLTRDDVEFFCDGRGLKFVTDKTNFETIYTRNKIRIDVLPMLEKINTNIVDALAVLAENSSVDSDYIEKIATATYNEVVTENETGATVNLEKLMALDTAIRRRIVIKMAENSGVVVEHKHILAIETLCHSGTTGKNCDIPGGCASVEYDNLKISKSNALASAGFCIKAISGEHVSVGEYDICVTVFENAENTSVVIRNRADGDKIVCNGMRKKLKQIFIDLKIPRLQREEIPIVEINGEIVCVGEFLKSDSLKQFKDKIKVSINKRHV